MEGDQTLPSVRVEEDQDQKFSDGSGSGNGGVGSDGSGSGNGGVGGSTPPPPEMEKWYPVFPWKGNGPPSLVDPDPSLHPLLEGARMEEEAEVSVILLIFV